jgi:putative ATPase
VEKGDYTFIGATTENPSFRLNSALLSRCRVFVLNKLEPDAMFDILKRAASLNSNEELISDELLKKIGELADGG